MTRIVAALVVLMGLSAPAAAEEVTIGDLIVKDAWVRLNIEGRPAAGYVTVSNEGDEDDRLIAVSTPMAVSAELHDHEMSEGQMRMVKLEGIDIPAHDTVVLESGGLHIMLMGLVTTGEIGELIPLTFTFEKAGQVSTAATVKGLGE